MAFAIVVACLFLAGLVLFQGKLLFGRTTRIRRAKPGPAAGRRKAERVVLDRPGDVKLEGWLTTSDTVPQHLLIWFGGRNENVAWTPDLAGWLPDDCALLAFNYRSLGRSTGWPSERACVADALAIAAWGLAELTLPASALSLAGRSIGSGVAIQLAARLVQEDREPAKLTLITPPKSLRALIEAHALLRPLAPLLRSPFDSMRAAVALQCPVLMLLAEQDGQVPHAHSMDLAQALRAAGSAVEVKTLAGTHHRNLVRAPEAMGLLGRWLA